MNTKIVKLDTMKSLNLEPNKRNEHRVDNCGVNRTSFRLCSGPKISFRWRPHQERYFILKKATLNLACFDGLLGIFRIVWLCGDFKQKTDKYKSM